MVIAFVIACIAITPSINAQQGGTTRYFYDDNGRLRSVILPTGQMAIYQYDAAGNIVSILHQLTTVTITEFTPTSGRAGDQVIIRGEGFGATVNDNAVFFNGVSATIVSATSAELIVTVPDAATTGPITVGMPTGSTTTGENFTVITSTLPPTIDSFTPVIGTPGTSVTIIGTNFDPIPTNDQVKFNIKTSSVSAATATNIVTTVPDDATSGRITVTTPLGNAVSNGDFFVPPPPFTVSDVEFTGRMAIGDTGTVTLNTANTIGLMLFDGIAGQNFALQIITRGIPSSNLSIINPDGTVLTSLRVFTNGQFIDTVTLPVTGTYTILVDPEFANKGSLTFKLINIPPDATSVIAPGGPPVTLAISNAGQRGRLTFNGVAGQRVSLFLEVAKPCSTAFSCCGIVSCCGAVSILAPDSTVLATSSYCNFKFIDTVTLPVVGTYTILIDPRNLNTAIVTCTLYDVPPDFTATITPGGPPVDVVITTPGQNGRLTFNGIAGQRISVLSSASVVTTSILDPNSTVIVSTTSGFISATTLPVTGTYTIMIDLEGHNAFTVRVTLYDVPPDVTAIITPGGPPVTVTSGTPGQGAKLTFDGAAGQRVSLKARSLAFGFLGNADLLSPDGTILASIDVRSSETFMDVQVLPATGTYTIQLVPQTVVTVNATFTLYGVPPDVTGTITVAEPSVTVTIGTPGQNANLTFNGTAGQQLTIRLTNNSIGPITITLLDPDGMFVTSLNGELSFDLELDPLSATGTYTIVIDPEDARTGSVNVTLTSP